MRLSRTAKIVLGLSGVLAICLFLVIADLGMNAGRIHYGVRLDHIDLGGLTEPEAVEVLEQRGMEMSQAPIFFHKQGVKCTFLPPAVGWKPRARAAAAEALAVGRQGSLLHAGGQRLRSWFGGTKVRWPNSSKPRGIAAVLDQCESRAASVGLKIARWKMRMRIKRALVTWPRHPFRIPFMHAGVARQDETDRQGLSGSLDAIARISLSSFGGAHSIQ